MKQAVLHWSVRIETYAEKQIQIKTRAFLKRQLLPESEFQDIAQVLRLHVKQRYQKYNSRKSSSESFICMLIDRKLSHIKQHYNASKRDNRKTDYIENIIAEHSEQGSVYPSSLFYFDDNNALLENDLDEIFESMPKHLKILCESLKEHNVSDVARILGRSRGSIRNDIKKIRQWLSNFGINNLEDIM